MFNTAAVSLHRKVLVINGVLSICNFICLLKNIDRGDTPT